MNSDTAFLIGSSHDVCQDYAVAGVLPPAPPCGGADGRRPYVIVSDGCSSSPDTDTGARLLVRAAQRLMLSSGRPPEDRLQGFHEEAARVALSQAELMGLPPQAVDATLLTAHVCCGKAKVACYGDGVVVLQSRSGITDAYSVSYPAGYPFYPSYVHQPDRLGRFSSGGDTKEVRHYRSKHVGGPLELHDGYAGGSPAEVFTVTVEEYKFVAVFSDGIQSFHAARRTETGKSAEPVTIPEVLGRLLPFKTTHGAFVRRRLKRFAADCRLDGWRHLDDLSAGVLYLGEA